MRRKENEDYQTNLASHLSLLSNPNRIFPQCYLKQKSASILFNFQNMIRSHQIHPLVTLFCLLTEVSFELLIGSSELSNCSQFVSTLTTELLSFFILLPRGLNWFLPPEINQSRLGYGLVPGSHPRLCPRSWSRSPDYPSIQWVLPPCPPSGCPGWW